MPANNPTLARCLEALSRAGGDLNPGFLDAWIPPLQRDPDVARELVQCVAASSLDETDEPSAEQELLGWLLDEARRAGEDGRDIGPDFLRAAEDALEAMDPARITVDGLFALGRTYSRAGLAAPATLMARSEARHAGGPETGAVDPDDSIEELEASLRPLLEECGDDLHAAHGVIVETLASVPEEPRVALIGHLAALNEAVWQRLAVYWLLDPDAAVREAVARAYHEHARRGTLDTLTVARLPLLRSWLPTDTARRETDQALAAMRRRGAGAAPFPDAARIDAIHASLPDGAGAQYIAIATGGERDRHWAMVLVKSGYGVRDAYRLPELAEEDEQEMLERQLAGMDAVPIGTATLHVLLGAAIAEGLAREEPPAPGLVDVAAACGLIHLRPQPLTSGEWLARLDPGHELEGLSAQKRGRLINRSAEWIESFITLESWFEDTSACDRILSSESLPSARRRALRKHLEHRRDWWAGQCFRAAMVLWDTANPDLWRSFAVTGAALLDGRDLKRIPIMEQILEATIECWEHRDSDEPEPLDPAAFAGAGEGTDGDLPGASDLVPFSERHRRTLQAFYDEGAGAKVWDAGYFGLHGYLFAVATHPDLVPPSDWLPPLLDGDAADGPGGPASPEAGAPEEVLESLLCLYNTIIEQVLEERAALPADCTLRERPQDNFWPGAPVGEWSRGFGIARKAFGHQIDLLHEEFGEEDEVTVNCGIATMILEVFGDREGAQQLVRENPEPGAPTLQQLAAMAHEGFEEQLRLFASLAGSTRGIEAEPPPPAEAGPTSGFGVEPRQPVRVDKIGRNEPCPCGSGRKYKHCCGDRRQQ